MLRAIYVDNFRCFSNFKFQIMESGSAAIIGANASGKSSIGKVLSILQAIAGGSNHLKHLFSITDLHDDTRKEIKISIVVEIKSMLFTYSFEVELPSGFTDFRVRSESLEFNDKFLIKRELSAVSLLKDHQNNPISFGVDWHACTTTNVRLLKLSSLRTR